MLATKQNISSVIDDCDLYEDGLLIVAARRHSIAWYSRDPNIVIRPVGEINVVLPYTHGAGAVIADGVFAYMSTVDGTAQCMIVDRNQRAVRMIEPVTIEHVNASAGPWHYVGRDTTYASWGYWAACLSRSAGPQVIALDMTGTILSGRGHRCVIGAVDTSDVILRDITGAEPDRVLVPACTPPVSVYWLYDGACYVGNGCELTDTAGHTLRFDNPIIAAWDSPDGPVAVESSGETWQIATSAPIPRTKYENYEWIWYSARHGDWIALDVSGRAVGL